MKRLPAVLRRSQAQTRPKTTKSTALAIVKAKATPKRPLFIPPGGDLLPDTERYKCRFNLPSANPESDAIYRVSFDMARKTWVCSCRGFLRWQSKPGFRGCHHITDCGLQYRKGGDELTYKQMLLRGS